MALPEKLYALRKKSGLSQEQLAEALNVSRQAISKWEGGSTMPESDKLLALSNYFGVSLDYLLKDGAPDATPAEAQEEHRTMRLLSLILCFGGAAALIVYGVLSILVPSVPAQISGPSMIRIDGSGIFLLLCVAAIVILAAFVVRSLPQGRSCFYAIGAASAVTIYVVQAMLNVFGTTDILPLTGVTFPFVSNGGSSMICVWGLLAFIKAADTRQNASFAIRLPGRKEAAA